MQVSIHGVYQYLFQDQYDDILHIYSEAATGDVL